MNLLISYTPYVPAAYGCSSKFTGDSAADVAEQVMRSARMRGLLNLDGLAGHILHRLELSKAKLVSGKLQRTLTVWWQAMQTVPQQRAGTVNPVIKKTVVLQDGHDSDPDAEWIWTEQEPGKLVASRV